MRPYVVPNFHRKKRRLTGDGDEGPQDPVDGGEDLDLAVVLDVGHDQGHDPAGHRGQHRGTRGLRGQPPLVPCYAEGAGTRGT